MSKEFKQAILDKLAKQEPYRQAETWQQLINSHSGDEYPWEPDQKLIEKAVELTTKAERLRTKKRINHMVATLRNKPLSERAFAIKALEDLKNRLEKEAKQK